MIVDFHTHIFPPGIIKRRQDFLRRDPTFAELYASPKAKLATAEELVSSMDEAGVEVSVALNFAWSSHELCVETNDYLMEAMRRFKGRLIAFGAVFPPAGDRALKELQRCTQGGMKGLGELRLEVAGEGLEAVLEEAKRLGLIVLLHASEPVGHSYPGKGAATPERLYSLIQRFPGVKIVLAHWGGGLPFYALMPEVGKALSSVYVDTAASPLLYDDKVFLLMAEVFDSSHILFGSDFPLFKQGAFIQRISSLGLPPEVAGQILGENAKKLLGVG